MTVLEGTVQTVRHDDGRVEILHAPPTIRVSLELVQGADPVALRVSGRNLIFGGRVVYRVDGWDDFSSALTAVLIEDRRTT